MQTEMNDSQFELQLPPDFDEGFWDSKGYFRGAVLVTADRMCRLTFYDPVRLTQDVQAELESSGFFFEQNLVVVEKVTREVMRNAVERIIRTGVVRKFCASDEPKESLNDPLGAQ